VDQANGTIQEPLAQITPSLSEVFRVTFDMAHLTIPQVDAPAAAAGAHVAGGLFDLVATNITVRAGFRLDHGKLAPNRMQYRSLLKLSRKVSYKKLILALV
jgi:hypothetical protein